MDSYSERRPVPVAHLADVDPFSTYNNIHITAAYTDGSAVGTLAITAQSLNPHGIVHGGCLATLADTVAGQAVFLATSRNCVTVNYAFNFLRPAKSGQKIITCTATPEKLGGTLCVYHVSLTDESGAEVANGNFTFFLLDALPPTRKAGG